MLNFPVTLRLLVMIAKVHLIFGNNRIFCDNGEVHDVCQTKRREYRKHLRKFLNQNWNRQSCGTL